MAMTVTDACRELTKSMLETVEALAALPAAELVDHSEHVCAQGKDVWALITNDIDHERIHVGQLLEARYESRLTQDRLQRLLGDWIMERARLVAALISLPDDAFQSETAPGQWTYERIIKHVIAVERDSVASIVSAD